MGLMRTTAVPKSVITVARSFVAAALFGYFFDLLQQTHKPLVNAAGRPFGDDWVNYWSAAYLALHGRAAEIYDPNVFHVFHETIVGSPLDGYHYSYPPVMLLLTAPFALIPYVPALFVWLSASWYAFYRALKLAMPGRSVLLLALAAPAVAHLTGIAFGPLFILPLFIVALPMSFGARGAAVSASSPRLSSAQP